jgi:hypothetical protein
MEARFRFHVHLLPKQKHVSISIVRELEMETRFRFCLSVVNSAKNDPAKMGQAKLPTTGRFSRGQKKRISSQTQITKFVLLSIFSNQSHLREMK